MTVLVGTLCTDGVVVGADSVATSAAGVHPLIQIRSDDKVVIIGERVIIASTGAVGLSQRFCAVVEQCFGHGVFNQPCINCMKSLSALAVQDFGSTGAQRTPQNGIGFGALVAAPMAGQPELVEFNHIDLQPERKTGRLHFVSMGSGQVLADPFIAFVSRVLWGNSAPTVQLATLGVYWTLSHAIQYAPGGVGEPIKIATLRKVDGDWRASLVGDDQMQEAAQHIEAIEDRIGKYPVEVIQGAPPPPSPIPKPPSDQDGETAT
jgi:hypothetical protein